MRPSTQPGLAALTLWGPNTLAQWQPSNQGWFVLLADVRINQFYIPSVVTLLCCLCSDTLKQNRPYSGARKAFDIPRTVANKVMTHGRTQPVWHSLPLVCFRNMFKVCQPEISGFDGPKVFKKHCPSLRPGLESHRGKLDHGGRRWFAQELAQRLFRLSCSCRQLQMDVHHCWRRPDCDKYHWYCGPDNRCNISVLCSFPYTFRRSLYIPNGTSQSE